MPRKPVVAGQFYEGGFNELQEQIDVSFTDVWGPGAEPIPKRKGRIKGIIAPHQDYVLSGGAAAWAYKELGEAEFADVYIILGVNHMGTGTCVSDEDWETPFGIVKADDKLVKQLAKDAGIDINNALHEAEHSIEVQLPLLQYVSRDSFKKLRIVPVLVSNDVDYRKLGVALKTAMGRKKACIIASSDFTHYGTSHGFAPFGPEEAKQGMEELDLGAIDRIKNLDSDGFLEYVKKTGATICGAYPIAVLLECIKPASARLLRYYTSGDVLGEYDNAVGYAALVFK